MAPEEEVSVGLGVSAVDGNKVKFLIQQTATRSGKRGDTSYIQLEPAGDWPLVLEVDESIDLSSPDGLKAILVKQLEIVRSAVASRPEDDTDASGDESRSASDKKSKVHFGGDSGITYKRGG